MGGFVPVIGIAADGANAILYCYDGDYINALISAGAAVPILEYGKLGIKLTEKVEKAEDFLQKFDFDLQLFAKDGSKINKTELHHIATDKSKKFDFKNHPAFKETGIDVSKDIDNLIDLAGHRGRHTNAYHQEIQRRLDAVYERYGGSNELENAVRNELRTMKEELLNGSLNPYGK